MNTLNSCLSFCSFRLWRAALGTFLLISSVGAMPLHAQDRNEDYTTSYDREILPDSSVKLDLGTDYNRSGEPENGLDTPLTHVPSPNLSGESISAGDVVRLRLLEDPRVSYEGQVSASGTVLIPYYGEFSLAGMTEAEAAEALEEELTKELYQEATVSATLISRGPGRVYVYGAVQQPGAVPLPKYERLTILRLILLSNGLTSWAAPEQTFVLRRKSDEEVQRISIDLSELFVTTIPHSKTDITLRDGDIVVIPGVNGELYQFMTSQDREVLLVGEVRSPGMVYFGAGELRTVMRAIFKAGGFTEFARKTAVKIIRYERDQSRSELVVDAAEIMEKGYLHKDVELQPGDMLIVPAKHVNF